MEDEARGGGQENTEILKNFPQAPSLSGAALLIPCLHDSTAYVLNSIISLLSLDRRMIFVGGGDFICIALLSRMQMPIDVS